MIVSREDEQRSSSVVAIAHDATTVMCALDALARRLHRHPLPIASDAVHAAAHTATGAVHTAFHTAIGAFHTAVHTAAGAVHTVS